MDLKQILYIEDNIHNRRIVRKVLESQGYALIEAEDGQAGLNMVRNLRPPLILLDIGLPKMDGLEVLSRIRNDAELCDTPVIAITATVVHGARQRFLDAGCDDYVPKPVPIPELIEKVKRYFGTKSKTVESRQ